MFQQMWVFGSVWVACTVPYNCPPPHGIFLRSDPQMVRWKKTIRPQSSANTETWRPAPRNHPHFLACSMCCVLLFHWVVPPWVNLPGESCSALPKQSLLLTYRRLCSEVTSICSAPACLCLLHQKLVALQKFRISLYSSKIVTGHNGVDSDITLWVHMSRLWM